MQLAQDDVGLDGVGAGVRDALFDWVEVLPEHLVARRIELILHALGSVGNLSWRGQDAKHEPE